jgi:hypothetical protein
MEIGLAHLERGPSGETAGISVSPDGLMLFDGGLKIQ